ncbi:hypothetical protein FA10DRAFT_269665 [Acaromyces ingoldii]|uniref:Uncharacterized protein n=1 Tax=Acaromyces ingoldii TaxID=215250 RepID=A0A316YCW1_9BASI|nr:hypothetical protein FA10DRAFT_269665 [Acaromyces ingoldii]PWN87062.1 hypothetical protein FA10DRAFT_269665 [Acaromyces ingoldii]
MTSSPLDQSQPSTDESTLKRHVKAKLHALDGRERAVLPREDASRRKTPSFSSFSADRGGGEEMLSSKRSGRQFDEALSYVGVIDAEGEIGAVPVLSRRCRHPSLSNLRFSLRRALSSSDLRANVPSAASTSAHDSRRGKTSSGLVKSGRVCGYSESASLGSSATVSSSPLWKPSPLPLPLPLPLSSQSNAIGLTASWRLSSAAATSSSPTYTEKRLTQAGRSNGARRQKRLFVKSTKLEEAFHEGSDEQRQQPDKHRTEADVLASKEANTLAVAQSAAVKPLKSVDATRSTMSFTLDGGANTKATNAVPEKRTLIVLPNDTDQDLGSTHYHAMDTGRSHRRGRSMTTTATTTTTMMSSSVSSSSSSSSSIMATSGARSSTRRRGHVVKSIDMRDMYASRQPRQSLGASVGELLGLERGRRTILHRGTEDGPVLLSSTPTRGKSAFSLERTPTVRMHSQAIRAVGNHSSSHALASPSAAGRSWRTSLGKADFYGQRWQFSLPATSELPHPPTDPTMVTSAAIGITDGQRHFQWEGSHLLKLTEKGTGTHRTRALFRRDVKETRGAGTLEYDADFPDVDVLVLSLLVVMDWICTTVGGGDECR